MVAHVTPAGHTRARHILAIETVAGQLADLVEIVGAGVPDASAKAELSVNPAGDDNALTFTAKAFGPAGNNISIAYVDPEEALSPLSVTVVGSAITVSLETNDSDPTPAIITTAAEIKAAIEGEAAADALVDVAIDATDSGSGDDGSGVVAAAALALLEGGAGVGVGVAGTGSRYTDVDAGTLYLNTGDKVEPVWAQLAPV